jgi:hypothetical protein
MVAYKLAIFDFDGTLAGAPFPYTLSTPSAADSAALFSERSAGV